MKGKITINGSTKIDLLVDKYLNGEMSNDEWSRLTPAVRKRIIRQSKEFK